MEKSDLTENKVKSMLVIFFDIKGIVDRTTTSLISFLTTLHNSPASLGKQETQYKDYHGHSF
jgi:hypothetical protein